MTPLLLDCLKYEIKFFALVHSSHAWPSSSPLCKGSSSLGPRCDSTWSCRGCILLANWSDIYLVSFLLLLSSTSQGTGCWACNCKTWESNAPSFQEWIVPAGSDTCSQKWLLVSHRIVACTQPHDCTFISVWMYIPIKMFTWKLPSAPRCFHQYATQGCLSWQKKWQSGFVSGPPWAVPHGS